MPCNSDHLNPNKREIESKRIITLLKEVGLRKGGAPFFGAVTVLDKHTDMLCSFCRANDVTEYSLELQIWWRDHKKADKKRGIK